MIDIYMGMYYNTIISWSLYYLWASCQSLVNFTLPWEDCNHAWNTNRCQTLEQRGLQGNSTSEGGTFVSPAEEYSLYVCPLTNCSLRAIIIAWWPIIMDASTALPPSIALVVAIYFVAFAR